MRCTPDLLSAERGGRGVWKKIGRLQIENCFCRKRQRGIIKMDEQRAAAVLSRFKGGGYDADGLLHT